MSSSICPQDKIIYDDQRGEYICTETGEVLEEKVIDQGADWRAYTSEEEIKRSRVGSPINQSVHDYGITTYISNRKTMSAEERIKNMKLVQLQKKIRYHGSSERMLIYGIQEIERLSSLLNLPKNIKDEASMILRKVHENGLMRGRRIENIVAAIIYIACRRMKMTRTLDEISYYTNSSKTEIAKYYRFILNTLNLDVPSNNIRDFLNRISATMDLDVEIIDTALKLEERIREIGLSSGKDPKGIAGAIIYIVCILNGKNKTQKEISRVAGCTEITLRNRYKEIIKELDIKLPINEKKSV